MLVRLFAMDSSRHRCMIIQGVLEQACKPGFVSPEPHKAEFGLMTIHLAPALPSGSSNLPGNSSGPPSSVPLFGLAPDGVCLAPAVTDRTGELLPRPFTLTRYRGSQPIYRAVFFLWHFPARHRDWALPSILSCGARTFLPFACRQSGGHSACSNTPFIIHTFQYLDNARLRPSKSCGCSWGMSLKRLPSAVR